MGEAIAQFSPFVDGAWGFWGAVTPNMTWEGKLFEEFLHPFFIFTFVGIDLGVGSLQIYGTENPWSAMTWPGQVNHIEVVFFDEAVEVNIGKAEGGRRSPMPQETRFDLFRSQRIFEERVVFKVDHSCEVVAGSPISVDLIQFFGTEGLGKRIGSVHKNSPQESGN